MPHIYIACFGIFRIQLSSAVYSALCCSQYTHCLFVLHFVCTLLLCCCRFVFDDNRCCLYYYNTKDELTPAG